MMIVAPSAATIATGHIAETAPHRLPETGAHADGARPGERRRTWTLLLMDDDRDDRARIKAYLQRRLAPVSVWEAPTAEAATRLLRHRHFDCVLFDVDLADGNGLALLEHCTRIRATLHTAWIVLTRQGAEQVAATAMRAGVLDYLHKDQLTAASLERSIRNAVEKTALRSRLAFQSAQLAERNQALRQRNQEIQRFYQTVCHELRTPLSATREFIALLADGVVGEVSAEQQDLLRLASQGCDQIAALLDDLLDVARLQTGKLQLRRAAVPVGPLLDDLLRVHGGESARRGVTLRRQLPREGIAVNADPLRLRQVLSNLVSNALRFTPAGGVVTLAASLDGPRDDWVRLSVIDTGYGIREEDQPRVFERLFQSSDPAAGEATASGLGLGLSICRDIVEQHGSCLHLHSRVGEGSTFSFPLPMTTASSGGSVAAR